MAERLLAVPYLQGTSASARPTLIASILGFSVTNNLGFDASLTNFWTATNAATAATAIGLGATNNVNFNQLTATGNVTMNGVNNTATAQTADSASSLMTRDLVGQEFANPRTKMQTTYWFGLEGLGGWQAVNGGANAIANRGPQILVRHWRFTQGQNLQRQHLGVGVRLGANTITGSGTWRPIDGGAFTVKTHVVNYYSSAGLGNRAFGFLLPVQLTPTSGQHQILSACFGWNNPPIRGPQRQRLLCMTALQSAMWFGLFPQREQQTQPLQHGQT